MSKFEIQFNSNQIKHTSNVIFIFSSTKYFSFLISISNTTNTKEKKNRYSSLKKVITEVKPINLSQT